MLVDVQWLLSCSPRAFALLSARSRLLCTERTHGQDQTVVEKAQISLQKTLHNVCEDADLHPLADKDADQPISHNSSAVPNPDQNPSPFPAGRSSKRTLSWVQCGCIIVKMKMAKTLC